MSELQTRPGADVLESVIVQGDLSNLTPQQRIEYYLKVCDSLGLNPVTRPFAYLTLKQDGKARMVLYALKDATDQLRQSRKVNVTIASREKMDDIYIVTAHATLPDGRTDESIGAVSLVKEDGEWAMNQEGNRYFKGNGTWLPLRGDALANALMKAESKAKRRSTLSICGLGWSDESEIETIPGAHPVIVDAGTGEIQPQIAAPKQADHTTTEQSKADLPAQSHWSQDNQVRKAFWAWTTNHGLTNDEVHKSLGVTHLAEYKGTREQAIENLMLYTNADNRG